MALASCADFMTAAIACGQALDDRQDQVVQVDCEQWKNSKLLAGSSLHFLVAVFGLVGVCALASYHHPNRPDQPDEALVRLQLFFFFYFLCLLLTPTSLCATPNRSISREPGNLGGSV